MKKLRVAMIPVDQAMAKTKPWNLTPLDEGIAALNQKTKGVVLRANRPAGLSGPDSTSHADVLLVPHLGSHRNANPAFFTRVTADQYLFTSNGKFGNPRDETLKMILDARRKGARRPVKCVFQFLNRDGTEELGARLDRFFASRSSDEFGYRPIFRSTADTSIFIDLLERVRY